MFKPDKIILTCPICGQQFNQATGAYIATEEKDNAFSSMGQPLCSKCGKLIHSCAGCLHQNPECAAKHYNGPIPKFKVTTVQTPVGYMQQQVPNIEEIMKSVCKEPYCHCAYRIKNDEGKEEVYCGLREVGRCDNWELHPEIAKRLKGSSEQ